MGITNIIAIRIQDWLDDIDDVKKRILITADIIQGKSGEGFLNIMPIDAAGLDKCMSKKLGGANGGYMVIAGIFPYWAEDRSGEFCRQVSIELDTEVIHLCWDMEIDKFTTKLYLPYDESVSR